MICVECTNPDIECLYSEFKSKYIKLTICPQCGNLADKYIEFDNVMIFLDVLLLKPQAYRHLAYNVVEEAVFGDARGKSTDSKSFLARYKKLIRYFILTVLFEVYLTWAYEEKSQHRAMIVDRVLLAPVHWQYFYFICQQTTERVTFCYLIDMFYRKLMRWPQTTNNNLHSRFQRGYFSTVLLVTTSMSLAVKCLPIIMLIWPYDNIIIASAAVDALGVFNTIEALRINTGSSYLVTTLIVLAATAFLMLTKYVSMALLVACFSPRMTFLELLNNKLGTQLHETKSLMSFIDYSLSIVLGYSSSS